MINNRSDPMNSIGTRTHRQNSRLLLDPVTIFSIVFLALTSYAATESLLTVGQTERSAPTQAITPPPRRCHLLASTNLSKIKVGVARRPPARD